VGGSEGKGEGGKACVLSFFFPSFARRRSHLFSWLSSLFLSPFFFLPFPPPLTTHRPKGGDATADAASTLLPPSLLPSPPSLRSSSSFSVLTLQQHLSQAPASSSSPTPPTAGRKVREVLEGRKMKKIRNHIYFISFLFQKKLFLSSSPPARRRPSTPCQHCGGRRRRGG